MMQDYRLKKNDADLLQDIVSTAAGDIQIDFNQTLGQLTVTGIEKSAGQFSLRKLFPKRTLSCKSKTVFVLDKVDATDYELEKDILIREYELANELGKHWDLLRWNVSKWFLSLQTIFVVGAAKGLLLMAEYRVNDPKHALLFNGLLWLAAVNIILCLIWIVRNIGIHAWHRASIKRLRLIEADPRLRGCLKQYTSILRIMKLGEGFPGANLHGTGGLECWGPPVAFIILWIGVIILAWTMN